MILCDGNYGLGAYGMDSVHNREPERSRVTNSVVTSRHISISTSGRETRNAKKIDVKKVSNVDVSMFWPELKLSMYIIIILVFLRVFARVSVNSG